MTSKTTSGNRSGNRGVSSPGRGPATGARAGERPGGAAQGEKSSRKKPGSKAKSPLRRPEGAAGTGRGDARSPAQDGAKRIGGPGGWRVLPFHVQHVEQLLVEVFKFKSPADSIVSRHFRANSQLGHRERGVIAEAVFAVLRHKLEFAQYAESGIGNQLRRLAMLGFAATVGRDPIAGLLSSEEVEWLERLAQIDRRSLSSTIRTNLPEWVVQELDAHLGVEQRDALAQALLAPAPLDLRVNTLKGERDVVIEALREAGPHAYECAPTPFSPLGIRLVRKPALSKLDLFTDGRIEVQDEGSQLLCLLLGAKRGEMIADFCAGAGGKTLALGAMMRSTGRLYAFDVSEKRLAAMKPRVAKSGLSNVHPVMIDSENDSKLKRLAGKFDRVLVDAPCSGLGTLRRNPDLKWRQTPQTVAELNVKQVSILASASRLVKPGGRLVYATCSLLRSENQAVVETFLAAHPGFVLKPAHEVMAEQKIVLEPGLRQGDWFEVLPHLHRTDGFFAAVLERAVGPREQSGPQEQSESSESE